MHKKVSVAWNWESKRKCKNKTRDKEFHQMENRSWRHEAKCNAKCSRQCRKESDLRSFFIWNNFECISSFVFLHREHRQEFCCMKKEDFFYILKKSSVFPRTIWRPSNLIVQFKWDTNLFKNMKKFSYWEDRAALLTYMSSTLSSDVVFLVRFPQDLRSWTWLQKMTGFPPWKKRIVRSRQVIERAEDIIVTVVGDVRLESIWTSMNQDLWFSALRCTRNHHLLSSFLKESVFLTRQCTVNFTNPNDMRPESQNAIIKNWFFRRQSW